MRYQGKKVNYVSKKYSLKKYRRKTYWKTKKYHLLGHPNLTKSKKKLINIYKKTRKLTIK